MPILHAIVLGITQGLSEFLPICSSGHLILVPWLFGWDDFAGDASLEKTFDVALHLGTLVGAIAYFRTDIVRYLRAAFTPVGRGTDDRRLAWLLVAVDRAGRRHRRAVRRRHRGAHRVDPADRHDAHRVRPASCGGPTACRARGRSRTCGCGTRCSMGVGQALALQPGVSRSGVTHDLRARWLGLGRDGAARFAFLMSLPITAGALAVQVGRRVERGRHPATASWPPFVWGIVASAASPAGWRCGARSSSSRPTRSRRS